MRSFYYFSKNKLKFVEIRNFQKKFVFLTLISSFFISGLIFGGYYIYVEYIDPDIKTVKLVNENKQLADKLQNLLVNYNAVERQIDSLSQQNNDLRLVTNLGPVTDEERKVGEGGALKFDLGELPSSSTELNNLVGELESAISRVSNKISFEKNNYSEIKKKLEYNKKLYESIPAIKPADGNYGDKFGMRKHPVLKIRRMHYGLDMLVSTGTPVYAPGAGKVIKVKRNSGLGLTVEIDHGFGYVTRYGHLHKALVKKGDKVKRGDKIALSGGTGKLSTGPHLHYEVKHNGVALNPRNFIYDDVKLFEIISKD